MLETRKKVEADLKEYPMLKRKETILKYESQHPQHVTEHEVIGALALSHSVQEMAGSAGYISDKTMRIALQFQDETERLNRDASFEIAQELFNVRRKMKKLEFYVSQLPPHYNPLLEADGLKDSQYLHPHIRPLSARWRQQW